MEMMPVVDKAKVQDFFIRVGGVARQARQANLAIARAVAPRFCPISLLDPKGRRPLAA